MTRSLPLAVGVGAVLQALPGCLLAVLGLAFILYAQKRKKRSCQSFSYSEYPVLEQVGTVKGNRTYLVVFAVAPCRRFMTL